MLAFADELRGRCAGLRVLNLGGGDVDTSTPMGSMLFTIVAALAQMEHEINESASSTPSPRDAPPATTSADAPTHYGQPDQESLRLVAAGTPVVQVVRDLGMSRATFYRRSRAPTAE